MWSALAGAVFVYWLIGFTFLWRVCRVEWTQLSDWLIAIVVAAWLWPLFRRV